MDALLPPMMKLGLANILISLLTFEISKLTSERIPERYCDPQSSILQLCNYSSYCPLILILVSVANGCRIYCLAICFTVTFILQITNYSIQLTGGMGMIKPHLNVSGTLFLI